MITWLTTLFKKAPQKKVVINHLSISVTVQVAGDTDIRKVHDAVAASLIRAIEGASLN